MIFHILGTIGRYTPTTYTFYAGIGKNSKSIIAEEILCKYVGVTQQVLVLDKIWLKNTPWSDYGNLNGCSIKTHHAPMI